MTQLATILILLISAQARASLDIAMVDTGNSISISNARLEMPATCNARPLLLIPGTEDRYCWSVHGQDMSVSLYKQIESLNMLGVSAKEFVWTQDNSASVPEKIKEAANQNPKIISMALAGEIYSPAERAALLYASKKGILLLAASGNDGGDTSEYPGGYKNVPCLLSVSSVDSSRIKIKTANSGQIYLLQYPNEHGTSYSTTRAAAWAAWFYHQVPGATCEQAKAWLLKSFPPPAKP